MYRRQTVKARGHYKGARVRSRKLAFRRVDASVVISRVVGVPEECPLYAILLYILLFASRAAQMNVTNSCIVYYSKLRNARQEEATMRVAYVS